MKPIHILFSLLLASTTGLPVRYDQRQEGDLNVHAHLENFIIVLIPSSAGAGLLDFIPLKKDAHHHQQGTKPSNDSKYISQGTGTKVSAPDFPAAKSPYKVDLDKSEGEITKVQETGDEKPFISIGEEVVIAQAPKVMISKTETKEQNEITESTTLMSSEEDVTTPKYSEDEPGATEKVEKDKPNDDPDKKENVVEKTEMKEDKKEEEKTENKDEKKTVDNIKLDDVPVIDIAPVKTSKLSKSIDFGIEAAKSVNGDVDEPPRFYFPQRAKVAKVPLYRHEFSSSPVPADSGYAHHLKMLRTGVEGCKPDELMTEDGECQPIKARQRSGQYFKPEDRLLPILQFGLAPADSD